MTTAPAPAEPLTAYSDLSTEEQNLYCQIQEMFSEDWTHEQVMEFMKELDYHGITTSDNLEDAFLFSTDTAYTKGGAKAQFAEYWYCDTMDSEPGAYDSVVVDWEATYDYALRYDMFFFEFDGDYFFFNSNY